jgi:hypothetical protein
MATSTTLVLLPRGASVRHAQKAAGWGERVRRLWQRVFARRDHAATRPDADVVGYEALSGLDARLLADIGAPEVLRDRARLGDDWRQQRAIDLERGYRTLGWRW